MQSYHVTFFAYLVFSVLRALWPLAEVDEVVTALFHATVFLILLEVLM